MTKYISLKKREIIKKTIFQKTVSDNLEIIPTVSSPSNFDYVIHIGYDKDYKDVFQAYNKEDKNKFCIFFGVMGDEY